MLSFSVILRIIYIIEVERAKDSLRHIGANLFYFLFIKNKQPLQKISKLATNCCTKWRLFRAAAGNGGWRPQPPLRTMPGSSAGNRWDEVPTVILNGGWTLQVGPSGLTVIQNGDCIQPPIETAVGWSPRIKRRVPLPSPTPPSPPVIAAPLHSG